MAVLVVLGDVGGAKAEEALHLCRAVVGGEVEMAAVLGGLGFLDPEEHVGRAGLGGADGREVFVRAVVDRALQDLRPEAGQCRGVGAVERDVCEAEHQSSGDRTGQQISVRYSSSGTPSSGPVR